MTAYVILAQASSGSSNTWLIIIGSLVGLGVVGGVIFFFMQKNQSSKHSKAIVVTESTVGNYKLLSLMMTGQTSQVWEVSEAGSGRHFAMKLLLPEHVHVSQQRHFLFHEASVGKALGHPKIIKILSVVRDPDNPYIIMEFFPGTNLENRIRQKDKVVKEHGHRILEQAATALAFLHERGWVHRDVKPANILVSASGEVRLIDFALAQRISKGGFWDRRFRRKGKIQGTRSYMSPEQIRGGWLDGRADIYSFGVSIFEVLTGRPPFRASSPAELLTKHIVEKPSSPKIYNPEVTDEIAALVLKMLAKKREDRPRDFLEFLAKFRTLRLYRGDAVKKKAEG